MLVDEVRNMNEGSLFKTDFYDAIDDAYKIHHQDEVAARKLNLFDNSKKRKDRLFELQNKLKKNLKHKITPMGRETVDKIQVDKVLKTQSLETIENILYKKKQINAKTMKMIEAPEERDLLQNNFEGPQERNLVQKNKSIKKHNRKRLT